MSGCYRNRFAWQRSATRTRHSTMSSAATLKPSLAATANRSRGACVGLILDSSVAIAAERRGDTVQAFLERVIDTAGDQEAALSAVGVVERVHGIHRAETAERRARREAFIEELLSTVAVYPLTTDIARRAGKWMRSSRAAESWFHLLISLTVRPRSRWTTLC